MSPDESVALAERILTEAGIPRERIRIDGGHPRWCVSVKGLGAGATDETDETMNEPHEVAAELARIYTGGTRATQSDEEIVAPRGTLVETPQDETYGETGASETDGDSVRPPDGWFADLPRDDGARESDTLDAGSDAPEDDGLGFNGDDAGSGGLVTAEPYDAEFSEFDRDLADHEAIAAPDLGEDIVAAEDEAGSQFIFGDNLHQMRTAAIGLVVQHALSIMPQWGDDEQTQLSAERNFAMGVAEKRWDDDPARTNALNALEGQLGQRNKIEASRDEKVSYLLLATREEIVAFDPEAGWP